MHIIIINGSPRKYGATARLLHAFEQRLQSDAQVEYVDLADLTFASCTGCCACYRTGRCHLDDDAEALSRRIAAADGLILGSPTYASNVSGLLKTFIDRGHFVIEQLLHEKYAVCVATGENYGSGDTARVLQKLLSYSGAQISGKLVCDLPFGGNPLENAACVQKVERIADRLRRDIQTKKKYVRQRLMHRVIFGVGLRPFVRRKGESYRGVTERWQAQGIR